MNFPASHKVLMTDRGNANSQSEEPLDDKQLERATYNFLQKSDDKTFVIAFQSKIIPQ